MSIYRGRNVKDFSLAASLYDSIRDNDFRGVSILLEKGADANIVLQGPRISPFHLVIGNDSADFTFKTTKLILQHGGNPNVQSDDGLTPLHIASAWGRIDIVKLCLDCGGDPEIRDSNRRTSLDYAIEYKHEEIANLLRWTILNSGVIFQNLNENENYHLILDKIVINNGIAEAEYEVDLEKENSYNSCNIIHNLQQLPQTAPNEYVRNWCRTHAVQISNDDHDECKVNKDKYEEKENSYEIFNFSSESNKFSQQKFAFVNCNRRKPNKNVIENFSLPYENSIKYKLRKTSSDKKKGVDIPTIAESFCKLTELSRESGIVTLTDTTQDISSIAADLSNLNIVEPECIESHQVIKANNTKETSPKHLRDTSSDYFTCNEISGSTNILEQNIFDSSSLTVDKNSVHVTKCSSHGLSFGNEVTNINGITNVSCNVSDDSCDEQTKDARFINITEVYKYMDDQKGIVLYEKRLLVNPKSDGNESNVSPIQSQSSKLSSLPASFDYDTDTLRNELTRCGYNPGPITRTTKRVYLRKLHHLARRHSVPLATLSETELNTKTKVYSMELEKALKNPTWVDDLSEYKGYEDIICKEFNNPDPSRKWREGVNKSSFTYLLLDPRITNNLPGRTELMPLTQTWQIFVSSIFYVGKGKRSRPYSHLYEAAALWKEKNDKCTNKKLQHILDIWNDNFGVICLHVFQNVIPVEAYTREASMINALKLNNIKNMKSGDFYGSASTWSSHQQRMLGVLLLYKAMLIFLNEGERQLRPADIN